MLQLAQDAQEGALRCRRLSSFYRQEGACSSARENTGKEEVRVCRGTGLFQLSLLLLCLLWPQRCQESEAWYSYGRGIREALSHQPGRLRIINMSVVSPNQAGLVPSSMPQFPPPPLSHICVPRTCFDARHRTGKGGID